MNYTKIDASNWGALNHIILAGNAAKGFPFPTLKNTDKKTNKVDIVVNQPQADTIREEIPKRDQDGKIVDAFARLLTLQKAINALERDRD